MHFSNFTAFNPLLGNNVFILFLKWHLLANEWGKDEWVKEPKETQGKYGMGEECFFQ